jgi:hypothetical protein
MPRVRLYRPRNDARGFTMQRVAIVYTPKEMTPNSENITADVVNSIANAIKSEFESIIITFDRNNIIDLLRSIKPDIILNLSYGYVSDDYTLLQPEVVRILESSEYPVAGSGWRVQEVMQDKLLSGRKLHELGFWAPRELTVGGIVDEDTRVVVKPRYGGCHNDVHVFDSLEGISYEPEKFVYQEFVPGIEFTIGIIEIDNAIRVLPPIQVQSTDDPVFLKFMEYRARCVKAENYPPELISDCQAVFRGFGMRDYARFDVRYSNYGIVFLDLNALPNLDPNISLLPFAARLSDISYNDLIIAILNSCAKRKDLF